MKQKNILLSLLLLLLATGPTFARQHNPEAYRLYDHRGQAVDYAQLVGQLEKADVVFFGEIHNCPITHWLEARILQSLHRTHGNNLALGMEMLEADNQLILDEHLQGLVFSDRFEQEARLWPNYATDYAPLVGYAREHHLPVVATNVPRRYAAMVKERGLAFLDSLSDRAKQLLPPLPIEYRHNAQAERGFDMMRMMRGGDDTRAKAHFAEAQALKDATMAWHIAQSAKPKMLHINGNIHSDGHQGIVAYLAKYAPEKKTITIRAVRQEDISALDEAYKGLADFYICVPEDMTASY